jgi:hypothetical protein
MERAVNKHLSSPRPPSLPWKNPAGRVPKIGKEGGEIRKNGCFGGFAAKASIFPIISLIGERSSGWRCTMELPVKENV